MTQFLKIILSALTIITASVVAGIIIMTPSEHDALTIVLTTFVVCPVIASIAWCLPAWKRISDSSTGWLSVMMLSGCGSLCACLIASALAFSSRSMLCNVTGWMMLAESGLFAWLFIGKMIKDSHPYLFTVR